MTKKNYFLDYADFISTYQNVIMKIQLRYTECQNWVVFDHNNGLLSDQDFDKLYNCRMDEQFNGYDSKYVLLPDEVFIIRKYADLDADGQVLSTFLKPEYLRKNEMLQNIFQSVRMFAYYDTLDFLSRRRIFRETVLQYYLGEKQKCTEKLNKFVNIYGQSKNKSSNYQKLLKQLEEINEALRYADTIPNMDDDTLYKSMEDFYRIKKQHYDWYSRMRLQEEYTSGNVYNEHLETIGNVQGNMNSSLNLQSEMREEYTEAYGISRDLARFLEEFIGFDLEELGIDTSVNKGFFGRNKKADDNRNVLFNIFKELIKLYGAMFYLENNFDIEENGKIIDVSRIFALYYKKLYKDVTYVDIDSFVNGFRKVVTAYYKRVLAEYERVLSKKDTTLGQYNKNILSNLDRSVIQTKLINEIYLGYNGSDSVKLVGFSNQETLDIYEALKAYILNGFSFEEQDIIKKKV